MHNFVQIETDSSLARDITSHAVINVSEEKVNEYKMKKKIAESRESLMLKQQSEIDSLKNDIYEIKTMIQTLIKR